MSKTIAVLKNKIEVLKLKRQELLIEFNTLKTLLSEQRRNEDLKKIEELKRQLLNKA